MNTKTKTKISDVEEFCKLYKINIPVESEFDYYIETLKRSSEFENFARHKLQDSIESFVDLEKFVSENGYVNVREYKNKCLDTLKDYILSTKAYEALQSSGMSALKMTTRDYINQVEEYHTLVSLDFVSANYSVLKCFQEQTGADELGKDWYELCDKFNIHKCLANSKSFRQIVFGNTNPKRLQTFQHEKIILLVEHLKTIGIADESIVFISHDEIIFRVANANSINFLIENYMLSMEKMVNMPIRLTPFSLKKIKKNTFVKTVYKINPSFNNESNFYLSEEYQTLHGVPGNKYYMYFKKYILNESVEDRDLLYYNDGELSKWWIQDEFQKSKKQNSNKIQLSLKDAMVKYPYIWDKLSSAIPDLSNEDKRAAIEVFVNTCKHCNSEPVGCKCWNDE